MRILINCRVKMFYNRGMEVMARKLEEPVNLISPTWGSRVTGLRWMYYSTGEINSRNVIKRELLLLFMVPRIVHRTHRPDTLYVLFRLKTEHRMEPGRFLPMDLQG